MMNTFKVVLAAFSLSVLAAGAAEKPLRQDRPNIIMVLIDDMGWGDFSCFGNTETETPNIDAMAKEGLRFHGFYVNSPICSPSRVAIMTGQVPQRWRISSFLSNRKHNEQRGVANWLDPEAPVMARYLQQAGYATGHFGKWHMGGQRDVNEAPPISAYGFDESLTNFEGMGAKLLPLTETPIENGGVEKGRIWEKAVNLGDPVEWKLRCEITGGFVDRAIGFIDQAEAAKKPFFINLWPDDVHTPLFPSVDNWADTTRGLYLSVLEEMDQQLGPLFDRVKNDPELRDNTLIVICSDNGPEIDCGSAGPFKGLKATLFEAGIRSPLVVWGPGLTDPKKAGTVNDESVFCGIDLAPSLLKLANVPVPDGVKFDGQPMLETLLGQSVDSHKGAICFRRPPDRLKYRTFTDLPDLAIREGKWKLLCDYYGSSPMLFNLETDPSEKNNLVSKNPEVVERLTKTVMKWNSDLPKDAGDPTFTGK